MKSNDLGPRFPVCLDADTDTAAIDVFTIPVNTLPVRLRRSQNTPLNFNGVNEISVSDPSIRASHVTAFHVTNGTLSVDASSLGGVVLPVGTIQLPDGTFVIVTGSGTNTLIIIGSVADTNAILATANGLTY